MTTKKDVIIKDLNHACGEPVPRGVGYTWIIFFQWGLTKRRFHHSLKPHGRTTTSVRKWKSLAFTDYGTHAHTQTHRNDPMSGFEPNWVVHPTETGGLQPWLGSFYQPNALLYQRKTAKFKTNAHLWSTDRFIDKRTAINRLINFYFPYYTPKLILLFEITHLKLHYFWDGVWRY